MSNGSDTGMPEAVAETSATGFALPERLELAIEARLYDIYSDIESDAERPRDTHGSVPDNYSDPDSDLDIMNDARKSDASLIEGTSTNGRPSMTPGLQGSASSASFATCASQYSHYSQYGPGTHHSSQPSNIKKLGRVGAMSQQSTAGSARCSWAQSIQSYRRGYTESETSHYSFADSEEFEDLYGEGQPSSSPLPDSAVVAGAASILKSRTPDGSLPGNPSSDGRPLADRPRVGGGGVEEDLRQYSRAWGGPSSSAWDLPDGGSPAQGRPLHGPTPPLQAWAAADDWGEELPVAASRSLAASYVGSLTEAKQASLCASDGGCKAPVGMPGGEDATAFAGAAGSFSGSSSSTCPPKPPKEGTSKSSAYIRKRRAAGGSAASGHS